MSAPQPETSTKPDNRLIRKDKFTHFWLESTTLAAAPASQKKTTNRGIGSEDGTSQKTSFGVRPRASLWQQQKSSEGGGTPRLGQRRTYLGDDGET